MPTGVIQGFDQKTQSSVMALTAGNKAFMWWIATGIYDGEW